MTSRELRDIIIISLKRKTTLPRLKTGATTISSYQFFRRFPDEPAAIPHVEGIRWPDGVICPHCNSDRTARQRVYQYHQCKDCREKFTVRTGAIFERSHIPMDQWLYGMYMLQTARKGVSSLQLSKELGITWKATWFMLHRLRAACGIAALPMSGEIEVAEVDIGGKESDKRAGKQSALGLRNRSGQTKARAATGAATIGPEIATAVAPGAVIYTD